MTQLVLDIGGAGLVLPESRKGGYSITEQPLSDELEMASGRMVRELRGLIYRIVYQYGYLSDGDRALFLQACETGWRKPIRCRFLLPTGQMGEDNFFVTEFTWPKFLWSRRIGTEEKAVWGDFRVELREAETH